MLVRLRSALVEADQQLGAVFEKTMEARDIGAVEVRHLLGLLRIEARFAKWVELDTLEGTTFFLETASLADVLTVEQRKRSLKLSEVLSRQCGAGLSENGALLRPTTWDGS
jgi:hypothetical protein